MITDTVVGAENVRLLPATTESVDGGVTPEGMVSTPAVVSDELLNPDGGPEGPHDQVHPALGQPLVAVMDIVDPPELRYAA